MSNDDCSNQRYGMCKTTFNIWCLHPLKIYLIHDLFSKLNIRKIIPETSPSFMVENQGVPGHKSIPFAQQTFHKRSTNVPMCNRNETKTIEIFPEFVLSKEILSKSKQSVFNKRNSGTIPNRFGSVPKTISELLSFRF